MSVVVVGLEHRTTPLEILERVTIADADIAKTLGRLRQCSNLEESVVLSTCLRTEIYAVVDRFHDAVHEIEQIMADNGSFDVATLEPQFQVRFDDDVATHLFEVAAGLESSVPGESEVLGQVRRAWERAHEEGVSGPVLAELFRHAVTTGKRVRSETAIARGTTSLAHAAVALAEELRPGGLSQARVLVVGAGVMGAGVVAALDSMAPERRAGAIALVNRSAQHGQTVTDSVTNLPVTLFEFDALSDQLAHADVVIAAVEATAHVIATEAVAASGESVLIDLGVPRNIDPAARHLPGVTLRDMTDLRGSLDAALEERRYEMTAAQAIVGEEVTLYRAVVRQRSAGPVIAALREQLEQLRQRELERHRGELAGLNEEQRAMVDAATRGVLAKLLHEPTMILKDTAGTPKGERLVEALRTLFDL